MPVGSLLQWLNDQEQADIGLLLHSVALDLQQPPAQGAGGSPVLGLAVSGGSDSMAMLHLMALAAPAVGRRLAVATVDHRLRPEAAAEAAFVAQVCAGLGLPHQVLVWQDHPASGNLMQAASAARYRLLGAWAQAQGITHVATAHTADDQAECFLMGLTRRAGLDGLTGMRPRWQQDGVTFIRPYLSASRAELRAYLARHGHVWREDPTNTDDRYARARARKAVAALAPFGIGLAEMTETIRNLADVQRMVAATLADTFARIGRQEGAALVLDHAGLMACDTELQRRLLVTALHWMSGRRHPPRAAALGRILPEIRHGGSATLGGCAFRITRGGLRITRESRALTGPAAPGQIWDHRWRVTGPALAGQEIRALGPAGLALMPGWRDHGLPRDALLASPAIWQGDRLIAAPTLCPGQGGWHAELVPPFGMFVLSH